MYSTQTINQQRWARQAAIMRFNRKNLKADAIWRVDIKAIAIAAALVAACTVALSDAEGAKPGPILAKSEIPTKQLPMIDQPKPETRSSSYARRSH